jgi:ADP-heptose:LPS heptosyltransferase
MVGGRNILIFHQAALGDFVITWPLALALSRMFPQGRISYVTSSSKGKLVERVLGVESVDAENGWHSLFTDRPNLSPGIEKLLAGTQLVVSFGAVHDTWSRNVRATAGEIAQIHLQTRIDQAQRPREDVPEALANHVTTHLLSQLRGHPIIHTALMQILRSIISRGIGFRRAAESAIVIHPGAGSPAKCWAPEKFLSLAESLKQRGEQLRFLLGEAESAAWPASMVSRAEAIAQVKRPQTYLDLLEELSRTRTFIGNDSGPGHLAGIIGVPTVSLFGTSPDRWRPIGPDIRVVQGASMDQIDVESVLRVVEGFNE